MLQDFENENKGDDFLNEFRQKVANQQVESYEQKRDELSRSKSVFIGAVSGIAMAAVVGYFILAPKYENTDNVEVPVVRRPQELVKTLPSDPGGMVILNQDKTVYDIIEKKNDAEKDPVKLMPQPEEPIAVVAETIEEVIETVEVTQAAEPQPVSEEPVREVIKISAENIVRMAENTVEAPATLSQEIVAKAKAAEQKPETPKKAEAPKKAATPKPSPLVSEFDPPVPAMPKGIPVGSWQIQVMSAQDQKAVGAAYPGMAKKHPVLAGLPHEVERADLGAKGVYYRLKVGAFREKTDGDAICSKLKTEKVSCIVVKKK